MYELAILCALLHQVPVEVNDAAPHAVLSVNTRSSSARSLAIDGNLAALGCIGHESESGYVQLYRRVGNDWVNDDTLVPNSALSTFGTTVAISDGNLFVGAPMQRGVSSHDAETVFLFEQHDDSWGFVDRLVASDTELGALFGWSMAADDDWLAVGAPTAIGDTFRSGAVYLFQRSNGCWTQFAKLLVDNAESGDFFGWSVDLNGNTLVVGAPYRSSGSGAAFIFTLEQGQWNLTQELSGSEEARRYGFSVATSESSIAVGSLGPTTGHNTSVTPGVTYIYSRADGMFVEDAKLVAWDGRPGDWFGASIAFNNGNTVVIAADHAENESEDCGAAYVFHRDQCWKPVAKLLPLRPEGLRSPVVIASNTIGAMSTDVPTDQSIPCAYLWDLSRLIGDDTKIRDVHSY